MKIFRKRKKIYSGRYHNLIQVKESEKKLFRKKQWEKQGKKCPLLNQKISLEDAAVDHKHKLKNQKPGPKGRGLIRGVLHFQANSLEGIIVKKFKRYGLHKFITIEEFLTNMVKYISNPPVKPKYIHWTEKPKTPKLGKREYNLIKKYYYNIHPRARNIPKYPKRPKNIKKKSWKPKKTKKWERLLKKATTLKNSNITPIKK